MMHDIFKLRYRVLPIASCEIARAAKTMPETVTALHNHKEFELLSITSGQVRITIGDIPYTVSAGDLVLVNSYALHAIEVEIGRSFFADCLSFDLSLLEEEAFSRLLEQGEYETVPLVPATHPLHGPLAACFEQALIACGAHADCREMLLRGSLLVFFGLLRQNHLVRSRSVDAGNNQFCREVFAFIQSYYAHEITSRHVADKLGYTQSYFCRLFKQQFGQSFRYYLLMYRISKAKQFFDEGCRSVTQTAEKVGFHNMSYFTQVFQQYTGRLPSHYLKSPD